MSLFAVAVLVSLAVAVVAEPVAVDAHALPAVKRVLQRLYAVRARGQILSGQHVQRTTDHEVAHVQRLTGKRPVVVGFDLLNCHSKPERWHTMRAAARQHWRDRGLITISWHETSPALSELDEGGYARGTKKRMSQQEFERVLTPGTELNRRWLEHLDEAAGWLRQLQDDGVVVLWRPYHEMTGGWFWWGAKKPQSFCRLWQGMFDRFTLRHGLHNLVWVWSAAQRGEDYASYCPLDCVDVVGVDIYRRDRHAPEFVDLLERMQTVAGEKPIALTEVGLLPPMETLVQHTHCAWFLVWGGGFLDSEHYGAPGDKRGNTPEIVKELYHHPACVALDAR